MISAGSTTHFIGRDGSAELIGLALTRLIKLNHAYQQSTIVPAEHQTKADQILKCSKNDTEI